MVMALMSGIMACAPGEEPRLAGVLRMQSVAAHLRACYFFSKELLTQLTLAFLLRSSQLLMDLTSSIILLGRSAS